MTSRLTLSAPDKGLFDFENWLPCDWLVCLPNTRFNFALHQSGYVWCRQKEKDRELFRFESRLLVSFWVDVVR